MKKNEIFYLALWLFWSCFPVLDAKATRFTPLVLTDDVGRTVTVKQEPLRIVSLSPADTEVVFVLGLGNKLVGVTQDCNYPPEAKKVAKVGIFSKPSLEKVVALKPDLVFATGGVQKELVENLEKLDIAVFVLYPNSIERIFQDILLMGRAAGVSQRAEKVVNSLRKELEGIGREAWALFGRNRPKVYFELWKNPYMTVGTGTDLHESIETAGGENIGDTLKGTYVNVSAEYIIGQNPDVIIVGYPISQDQAVKEICARQGWQNVTAVKKRHIYADIVLDLLERPGPRVVKGCREILERLKRAREN